MLSTWHKCLDASSNSVSDSQFDDAVPADDDDETSETWTQPWDLPVMMNHEGHSVSNTSDSQGGLHAMSAASKNIQTDYSSAAAKGTTGIVLCGVFAFCKIVILKLQ